MKKEDIQVVQEESLSKSLNTSASETALTNSQIKRFSIQETNQIERKGSIFDCFSKCMGMFRKRKESSLLETY